MAKKYNTRLKMNTKRISANKLSVLVLTLLLTINFTPIVIAFAENDSANEPQGVGSMPEIPGVPDNAVQYNKTEITPVAQMEQITGGEPVLFLYRNITMLINCTKNCETVLTADPKVTPKIFGLSIDPNQIMALTLNLIGSPIQGEVVREKNLNFYASIEPNATVELTAQLRLFINQTELDQELDWEVTPEKLTWMYWNGTQNEWVNVPSTIDQDGYLVCNTDHFSLWTVGEIVDVSEQTDDVADMTLIYGGIGAAVVAVLAVAIIVYSKRK